MTEKVYPTGPVECQHPGCTRSFQNEDGLSMHMTRAHSGRNWSTNKGKKLRKRRKGKRRPKAWVNMANLKPAKAQNVKDKTSVPYALRSKGKVPCPECDRTFKSARSIPIHMSRAHGQPGKKHHKKKRNNSSLALAKIPKSSPAVVPAQAVTNMHVHRINIPQHLQQPAGIQPIYHCPNCGIFLPPHIQHNYCGTCGYPIGVLREASEVVIGSGVSTNNGM